MTRRKQPRPSLKSRKLLAALPHLDAVLRGSLLERHTFHPAAVSCATCASGTGHLQWILNVNYPGAKNRQISLHPAQVRQVRQQLKNLDRVRKILEQVCEVNQQSLREERARRRSQDHD
jgi:hypothetical protein